MKPYVITKVIRETPDVVTLHFLDKEGKRPNFIAGQYVTVLFPDLNVPEGKAYSLSSAPSDPYLAITVKKLKPGNYSSRLHTLKVGDELLVSEPYGFLNPQFDAPLIMIAGGVGIAPLMSIMRDTLANDPSSEIELWYSNQTIDQIVFKKQLDDMTKDHKQFHVKHFITQQTNLPDSYEKGRIDIAKILNRQKPEPEKFYFICGRQNFVGDIWHALVVAGVAENKIATETFY
ncbi:FAD-binding oxidoreductase [Candidatus Saccharibacteria bacterium]|nr:FAD-binding oxidoreductase [Candidatus Saccharibacteria bacterium]